MHRDEGSQDSTRQATDWDHPPPQETHRRVHSSLKMIRSNRLTERQLIDIRYGNHDAAEEPRQNEQWNRQRRSGQGDRRSTQSTDDNWLNMHLDRIPVFGILLK